DLVAYHFRLLNRSQYVAARHTVADRCGYLKFPQLIPLQRRHLDAAVQQISARHTHNIVERPLNSVVNTADQTRAELHSHRNSRGLNRLTRSQAGRLLSDLDRCPVSVNLYNLANQTLAADAHHIGHIGIPHALRDYQRPGDLLNYASAHLYLLL